MNVMQHFQAYRKSDKKFQLWAHIFYLFSIKWIKPILMDLLLSLGLNETEETFFLSQLGRGRLIKKCLLNFFSLNEKVNKCLSFI